MKSKDVQEKTGLTRKAIEYYEDLGLVSPARDESGYRHYSDEDVSNLVKISIYRKLGLNLLDIEKIITSKEEDKAIANVVRDLEIRRKIDMKRMNLLKQYAEGGSIDDIRVELLAIEAQESIYLRLVDKFPGYLGQMLFMNYVPFLQGKLETKEQKDAYKEFVDFLDHMEDLPFTEEEKQTILDSGDWMSTEVMESVVTGKIEAVQDVDKWLAENDEIIAQYQVFKKSDDYQALPIIQLYEKMKTHFQESGFYDVAIPLIRKMSPEYDEYYSQMLRANEQLINKHKFDLV